LNEGSRGKIIYEGIPTDVKGYKEALKYLQKSGGYTEYQAREILRLRRPQVVEEYFRGQGVLKIPEEGKTTFSLLGREKIIPSKGQTEGINWLQREGRMNFITSVGEEEGKFFRVVSEQEKAFLRSGKYPYTKLRQQGKLKDTFEGLVGSKEIKTYSKPEATLYRELGVSRTTIPRGRKPLIDTSKVLVIKGEPFWSITDESILGTRGFVGGGKKSSQQFLEQLYKTEELKSSTILGFKKLPVTRPPKQPQILETPDVLGINIPVSEVSVIPKETTTNIPPQNLPIQTKNELGELWGKSEITPLSYELDKLLGTTQEKMKEGQKGKERLKEATPSGLTSIELLKSFEEQKPVEIFRDIQKQEQIQELTQKQGQQSALKFFQSLRQRTKIPETPKIPRLTIEIPDLTKRIKKRRTATETLQNIYGFYVRRKGKDIFTEGFRTQREAETEFKKAIFGTLRAGGGITKGGQKIKTSIFGLRPSKKDEFRLIQPREKRLSAKREVSEIQFFKRKGRKTFF